MISKGYAYHLVGIKDSNSVFKSVPIVNEFLEDLIKVSPEREINFEIDLFPNTQPILIPPYMMSPSELEESNFF